MRPRKKVKLADIAAETGVSVVTVSNALAGRDGVSPEMRKRIEACAETLGYRQTAKPEQKEELLNVSVIVPCEAKGSLPDDREQMLLCLKNAAEMKNIRLSLGVLDPNDRKRIPDIRWNTDGEGIIRHEGILVCGRLSEKKLHSIIDFFKVPVIGWGFMDPFTEIDYIMDDGFRGMKAAVRHLAELKHRDIIYIDEEKEQEYCRTDRLLGFFNGMQECGLISPADIPAKTSRPACGPEVLKERIGTNNLPDAVVCSSDSVAASVLSLLSSHGIRVPGDISLTGYRFGRKGEKLDQFFTSCVIPQDIHAEKCLDLIRKRIERGGGPDGVRLITNEFVIGRSTEVRKQAFER